jgi:beta-N-acetylhexosaminidase
MLMLAAEPPVLAATAAQVATDRQLAGQRVGFGFSGPTPPVALVDGIRSGEVGSVILFSGNATTADGFARLSAELQAVPRPPSLDAPLLITVDQEGGAVRRVPGPPAASAERLGQRPVSASASAGHAAGRLLCRAGLGATLAPVVDLARPGSVIAAQTRSFGSSPAMVAARAAAFAAGLDAYGVAWAPKHFPGFGGATETTDERPVTVRTRVADLRANDEVPYAALIARGAPMVMVATGRFTAFGSTPAALNPRVVTGELRRRLGFEGVVVTDALDTPALAPVGSDAEVAVKAARAGADLLIFTSFESGQDAAASITEALESGTVDRDAAQRSLVRILTLRWKIALAQANLEACVVASG